MVLASVVGGKVLRAQVAPQTLPVSFARAIWRVSDGLPEDTVQALVQAPDGRLWIGSTGGLATFDGAHIRNVGLSQPIGANSAFSLAVADDGTLWAGTEGGGLLHISGSSIKVLFTESGLTDGFVRSLCEDSHGQLWVGTDNGLFRLKGSDRLERIDGTAAIPSMAVHSIMEDRDGRMWVGGSRLVAIRPDGSSQTYTLPGEYSATRVKKILQAADGTVWVGTVGGLARLVGRHFERVPPIHATVRSLLQTKDGSLWIGTIGDGLWIMRAGQLGKVNDPGLLPSTTILTILEDSYGQVWIGTQVGLLRLSSTPVTIVPLPDPRDSDFETISGDNNGKIFVAARDLFTLVGGVASRAHLGLPDVTVRNVLTAQDGTLWVGTDGSGVYRVRNEQVTHYSAPEQLSNNFIRAFLESRRKEMWIATDEGLSVLTSRGATKFTEASGLAYFSTRCLVEDREGIIWVGTDRGLSAIKDGTFLQNDTTRALAHEKVWSILEDRQGALWFGTRDHGLFRLQHGLLQQFTVDQGLPSNSIYQLLQGADGTFWITGPNVIASAIEGDMDGSWNTSKQLGVSVYGMPYGAEGAQLYGGREPAGYIAPDGSVWFPTNRGVAHVVPRDTAISGPSPRVVLESVEEDGRVLAPTDGLTVPANVSRLIFNFSAVYLRPQNQLHFRYMLENFDHAWTSSTSSEKATYTNLRPGQYRFRVQAYDSSRPQAVDEVSIELRQTSHFYKMPWFYALCVLTLGVLVLLAYRMRVRQLHGRFSAVMGERSRMAREMHDTVIQSCTGVSALLEAIAITAESKPEVKGELLTLARQQTRQTIETARQVVWNIRHTTENDVDVVAAIRDYTVQIARDDVRFTVEVEGTQQVRLPASTAHELLMTVREAVYNALQHSGSQRINVKLGRHGSDLRVAIQDFGNGVPESILTHPIDGHYGIIGMRERMEKVHGEFTMISTPGSGTTVEVQLPLHGRERGELWA
jgi:ligand-binding sensor domain-containing protein/signal transduction histidine kinase